jgi:acetylornithine deacetylase/succinyl-diaminopimelate desuccinylase-like protein
MDLKTLTSTVHTFWNEHILPVLKTYVEIPCKSPVFDPEWERNGYIQEASELVQSWVKEHQPTGAQLTVFQDPGKTPLLFLELPGAIPGSVLIYGHLDKQPEMEGWRENLGPWKAVIQDNKLYGRGGADDGYAIFAAVAVLNALQEQGIPLPTIRIIAEFSEESGSRDLPHYIDTYSHQIGSPDLVICLDSEVGDYERFWTTTSLRGLAGGTLRVEVLKEGIHSGHGSGIVPSSFRILRELLDRLEDSKTGEILPSTLSVEIPENRIGEARALVQTLGSRFLSSFPWSATMRPVSSDPLELVLNQTWRSALSVTGIDGIPPINDSGNVLRPYTTVKLSMRIPPTLPADVAIETLKSVLLEKPPYDAKVSLTDYEVATGWNAPPLKNWLKQAIQEASENFFGAPALAMGEGGSIPFMSMLGQRFPDTQFLITGVLGPQANAHGPNEFLHLPYAQKLTSSIAYILAQFSQQ